MTSSPSSTSPRRTCSTGSTARRGGSVPAEAGSALRLGGGLLRLLVLAHPRQRLRRRDVGHGHEHAGLAELAGRLLPSRGTDAELLAEERDEDPCLLLAEAGEGAHVGEQLVARLGVLPHAGGVAPV